MNKKEYETFVIVGATLGIVGGALFALVGVGIVSIVLSVMCLGARKYDRTFILITGIINIFFAGIIGRIFLIIAYALSESSHDSWKTN